MIDNTIPVRSCPAPDAREATATEIARELTEVAPGIHRLRLPLPFPTQSVNAYIIHHEGEIDLVDTGDSPERHGEHWTAAFRHLGLSPARVRQIFVTHHHSDHLGCARHLQRLTGAPVLVLDRDLEDAARSGPAAEHHRTELVQLLIRAGMPSETAEAWRSGLGPVRRPSELPEMTTLTDGQQVRLGGQTYQVIWAPGHCDGQYCLYNPAQGRLFGADHLLQKMVPPISRAPGRRPRLVADYLDSLAKVERLEVRQILPGHGAPFADLPAHAARMREQVEHRLVKILGLLTQPITACGVMQALFPSVTRPSMQRFVLMEVVAYLEHLVSEGPAREAASADPALYAAPHPGQEMVHRQGE